MKVPKNNKKQWQQSDINRLKMLIRSNTPIEKIAFKLNRSIFSVYSKSREIKKW